MNNPKIFVSYSWKDKSIVQQLEADLKSAGAELWIDYSEARGGDNLPERISEALDWCDTFLLIWSDAAVSSSWVKLEWSSATSLRKRIIPCVLCKHQLPAILASKIYVDFHDYKSGLNQLLRALKLSDRTKETSIQPDIDRITELFHIRDEAISEKDEKKFLETQANSQEIKNGYSKGYLACSKLSSSILNIAASKFDRELPIEYIALVKEDYEHNHQFTHSGYIIYTLSRENTDFKIADLQIVIAFP